MPGHWEGRWQFCLANAVDISLSKAPQMVLASGLTKAGSVPDLYTSQQIYNYSVNLTVTTLEPVSPKSRVNSETSEPSKHVISAKPNFGTFISAEEPF